MDAEKITSHPSPKHEPKKMTSHGKKGWTSKSQIDGPKPTQATVAPTTTPDVKKSGKACGPNAALRKGPNDDLLLTDYVTWNGPDPDIRKGPGNGAKGAQKSLLCKGATGSCAKGPNPGNHKGPQIGSIFLQRKAAQESSNTRTR